jgi:CarD family transcriptional regulator
MPRAPVPPPPVPRGAPVSLPPPTHRPSASPLASAAASSAAPRPKEDFKAGDHVVYPTHGVGQVQGIETVEAAGYSLSVIVVTFEENRMTLRVPVNKAASSGLRKLAAGAAMQQALDTLKGRARIKRTMWSRRAQEYEAKINSGDPIQIAEVVRDLHRNAGQPDQSFSERQIYEQALRQVDFIQKYIFPGGYIPALSETVAASEKFRLIASDIETLRLHYAKTIRCWYANCMANRDAIIALHDERFFRMWTFYLAGAATVFEHGGMCNYQIQYTRSRHALPITRDYLYT